MSCEVIFLHLNLEDLDFYKDYYSIIDRTIQRVSDLISCQCSGDIEHIKTRVKSEKSTKAKLAKLGLDTTIESALSSLHDIIGFRIVCRFLEDVYTTANKIEKQFGFKHIISKDYIKHPKENGYRSYHIILEVEIDNVHIPIEIQIRTISQDSWASLEHNMKYKKEIQNTNVIKSELKRLADEMASADVCMQTLRELIVIS